MPVPLSLEMPLYLGANGLLGIAWWAVEGCPIVFELVGLGLGPQRVEW